jgi:regulator of protease activity HflC (stomatin/prohibitin superfamily)
MYYYDNLTCCRCRESQIHRRKGGFWVRSSPDQVTDGIQAEQERQAAVIRAEGEAEAAATISKAMDKAGDAFIALRKIEASKAIVQSLAANGNVTYIPSSGVLLNVPTK